PSAAAPPTAAAPKAVPPDSVVGAWKADGPGSSRYAMTLNKEGTFTWAFHRGTRKQEVKGAYSLEGNVLAIEPDTAGALLAELTREEDNGLQFRMIARPTNDPGLAFRSGSTKESN